jgi:nicotinate-nucleotide pyrophosphorylase (carboxylating)
MERWQADLAAGFLAEDVGRGDRTTAAVVPHGTWGAARIETRSEQVVAGIDMAEACFTVAGDGAIKFTPEISAGQRAFPGDVIARIEGDLGYILTAERTALNLLTRLSGIATLTAAYVARVAGSRAVIVDTRKTTPGLRRLEKQAVTAGGGRNHRWGLDDGILIKDNHIAAAGGVRAAMQAARANVQHGLRIEIEVSDLGELREALESGATLILLDNMSPAMVREAAGNVPSDVLLEVSGGITLENVTDYAEAGAHFISVGALTHSAPAADVSLEIEP